MCTAFFDVILEAAAVACAQAVKITRLLVLENSLTTCLLEDKSPSPSIIVMNFLASIFKPRIRPEQTTVTR